MSIFCNQFETWENIEGFENIYLVSTLGRVYRLEHEIKDKNGNIKKLKSKLMKTSKKKNGYMSLQLKGKDFLVHRLVLESFYGKVENKAYVNHINGIRHDNRLSNLEWCTAKENTQHAIKIGNHDVVGENNPFSKLNENDVKRIKLMLKLNHKKTEIAKIFNISRTTVYDISVGKTWSHIEIEV